MSERTAPGWGATAAEWAELWADIDVPAREAIAQASGIGVGTRVLDVGCGSGEFCQLAAARGAVVSGIDAAAGMIEIARRRVPDADLRLGAMERLPWVDDSFDVVTGFNAFQFAADFVSALAEAKRFARRGGQVAICSWGRPEDCEVRAVTGPLRELAQADAQPLNWAAIGGRRVLEALARQAGLEPRRAGEIDVPYEAPDRDTLERASRRRRHRAGDRAARASRRCARRSWRRPSRSGGPTAPTASRTGSGT